MNRCVRLALPCLIGLLAWSAGPASAQPVAPAAATGAPDFVARVAREEAVVVTITTTRTRPIDADRYSDASTAPAPGTLPTAGSRSASRRPEQERGLASGIVLGSDGEILTNAHAVADVDRAIVRLADGRQFAGRVTGLDKLTDLALLKIDAQGLTAARIGASSRLANGEWVVAIGAPFGLESSVTAGIVSASERFLPGSAVPLIQTDAAINPGNSGGPLFNLRGEVVGINSMVFTRNGGYMGVSFAVPIDVAMKVADELRASGRMSRGQLGARIQEVTPDLARAFALPDPRGALVLRVARGSPAERAGLRSGDIVTGIDDRAGMTCVQLQQQVAAARPGQSLHLTIWRRGSIQRVGVTVGEAPADLPARPEKISGRRDERLGLNLGELSPGRRGDLGIDSGLAVLEAHGIAWRHGVQADDVVVAVGDRPVHNLAEFDAALAASPPDRPIALLLLRDGALSYVTVGD